MKINEKRGSVREVTVQTVSPGGGLITKLNRSPDKLVPLHLENLSPDRVIPLEEGNEKIKFDISKKYTKEQISKFKKKKIWPPYKPSTQFLDPSSINTGADQDYVNKDGSYKEIDLELHRNWK